MTKKIRQNKKIARRRRKIALRRFWYFFRIFLMLVFFGAAIYGINLFYNSNYFKVKEIDIEGNDHYADQELMAYVSMYKGSNIFEVDKKEVEEGLLSQFYWLKEADLRKIFPNSINITVSERRPHIIAYFAGDYFLLDREGVVLEKIGKERALQMDRICLVKNALTYSPEPGDKVAQKNALSCGDIFLAMDNDLKDYFKEARLEKTGEIVFIAHDNRKVVFGTSEDISQKLGILKELLREEITYTKIDLNNFEIPVIN